MALVALALGCAQTLTYYESNPGSIYNPLTYHLDNPSESRPLSNVKVEIDPAGIPRWMRMKDTEVVIASIPPGETGVAHFRYDIQEDTPRMVLPHPFGCSLAQEMRWLRRE